MREIKPYYQQSTRWCSAFAVTHALMVFLSTIENKDIIISPWAVAMLTWRSRGYPVFAKRSASVQEIFEALKKTGINIKGMEERFFPKRLLPIKQYKTLKYLNKGIPILAILNNNHEVCIVDYYTLNGGAKVYEFIDSSSKKNPYRKLTNPDFTSFQVIL